MDKIEIPKILYFFLRFFSKKNDFKGMSEYEIEIYKLSLVYSFYNEVEVDDFSDIRILKKEERWDVGVEDYIYILVMVKYRECYYLLQENIV